MAVRSNPDDQICNEVIIMNAETHQLTFDDYLKRSRFSGVIDPLIDCDPLTSQIGAVFHLMKDMNWRTLSEIEAILKEQYPTKHFPQASLSAQLRNLEKSDYGWQTKNKRRREGFRVWEYQIIPRKTSGQGENKPLNESIGALNPLTPGN
jgi:hypothetical protein